MNQHEILTVCNSMNEALHNEVFIIPRLLGRAELGDGIIATDQLKAPPAPHVLPPHSPAPVAAVAPVHGQVELLVHVFVHDSSQHVQGGGRILAQHLGVELALRLTAAADDDGAGGWQLDLGGYCQGDVIMRISILPGGGGRVGRCGLRPEQFKVVSISPSNSPNIVHGVVADL